MKLSKKYLRQIIKEEKARILREKDEMSSNTNAPNNEHHWPRVEWSNVGELVDKWESAEYNAFDKGDPSMMAMGDTVTDAKKAWEIQVDAAAMDMENELTQRIRKLALQTMQEFPERLINGDSA